MNAEIVCIGTELLLGDIVNTNAQYLAKRLSELGINVYYQTVVGDNPDRIRDAVQTAFSRADLVITTGGLGPTKDDISKEVVMETLGFEPVLDKVTERIIRVWLRLTGTKEVAPEQLKQAYVPKGGTILDFGCGSGRDSKAFLDAGYQVVPLDGSPALCAYSNQLLALPVVCCKFKDYLAMAKYDGVWACASLLHLKKDELSAVLGQLIKSLNPGAPFYMSFKYGTFSGERNSRWFTDMTEERLKELMAHFSGAQLVEQWVTEDVRPERTEKWLNSIFIKNNSVYK